jgi:hypothetical protein
MKLGLSASPFVAGRLMPSGRLDFVRGEHAKVITNHVRLNERWRYTDKVGRLDFRVQLRAIIAKTIADQSPRLVRARARVIAPQWAIFRMLKPSELLNARFT